MQITTQEGSTVTQDARVGWSIRGLLGKQEVAILVPFLILLVIFYARNDAMLNPITVTSILRTMALPGIIAMGMVMLMISGEIDLSTGAVMSLSAVLAAKLIRDFDLPIPAAVLCAMGVAIIVGLANASLTVKVGIPSVIVTIGMAFIVRGISYSFANGLPIYPLPEAVGYLGSLRPLGISVAFCFLLVLTAVVQVVLNRTRWGAMLFATGGNRSAAQITGINTDRVKTVAFMVTSLLAACAGLLTMSQLPGTPGDPIIGRNLELDILAGVIIGGVSFYGGRGSAIGAFIGVMFIQLVRSGLVIGHFDPYLVTPALGILLVVAASADVIRHRRARA